MDVPGPARSERCSAALSRAFAILGKRWNGLILGALGPGPAGFAELSRAIGAISDSMLSDRLTELVAVGLVHRSVEPGPPVTVSYTLTEAGLALDPVLTDLERWVRAHLSPPEDAAVCEVSRVTEVTRVTEVLPAPEVVHVIDVPGHAAAAR